MTDRRFVPELLSSIAEERGRVLCIRFWLSWVVYNNHFCRLAYTRCSKETKENGVSEHCVVTCFVRPCVEPLCGDAFAGVNSTRCFVQQVGGRRVAGCEAMRSVQQLEQLIACSKHPKHCFLCIVVVPSLFSLYEIRRGCVVNACIFVEFLGEKKQGKHLV